MNRQLIRHLADRLVKLGWPNPSELAIRIASSIGDRDPQAVGSSDLQQAISGGQYVPSGMTKKSAVELILQMLSDERFVESVPNASSVEQAPKLSGSSAVVFTALPLETGEVLMATEARGQETLMGGTVVHLRMLVAADASAYQIAVVETGPGSNQAAAETSRVLEHAAAARLAVYVGVAGSIRDEVLVGDVVIAERVYDVMGGKETDEGFKLRPRENAASHAVFARVRAMLVLNELPAAALFTPSEGSERGAQVFVKPIATVPSVIASEGSPTITRLRDAASDAVALEMEGYGFGVAASSSSPIQSLVVRGISDRIVDKIPAHDAQVQPLAARNAVTVALAVVAGYLNASSGEKS